MAKGLLVSEVKATTVTDANRIRTRGQTSVTGVFRGEESAGVDRQVLFRDCQGN